MPTRKEITWRSKSRDLCRPGRRSTPTRSTRSARTGGNARPPTYYHFSGRLTSRLVDPLLDAAGVGPGTRVLDLATGPGYVAAKATERDASVVAVDRAPAMLQLARQRHPGIEFRGADAEAL